MNIVYNSRLQSVLVRVVRWFLARRKYVALLIITVFLALFATLTLSYPTYEWDLLPYIGNAMRIAFDYPAQLLHTNTYTAVIAAVPASAFDELTASPTREVLSQDPEAFRQTMAFFYDARIVYNYINAGIIGLGMDPVFALYLMSTFYAILSFLLLANLIPVNVPLGLYCVLPFIALSCGLLTVARLATPDALATLVTIFLYFLLFRNKEYWLLLLFPLVIFIRTDLILLVGLFHTYFFLTTRVSRIAIIVSSVATVAVYLLINGVIVDADPWSSLIGYNFAEKPTHPGVYTFEVTPANYIQYLGKGLKSFSYHPIGFVFCMLAVTGVVLYAARFFVDTGNRKASLRDCDILFLLISCVLYLILHILLFPVTWTRFFAAQYSLVAVVVVWTTFSILAERNYSARESLDLLK